MIDNSNKNIINNTIMKKMYIKPQIKTHYTCVKNYILNNSNSVQTEKAAIWSKQLTKERNDGDIWNSSDSEEEESIW